MSHRCCTIDWATQHGLLQDQKFSEEVPYQPHVHGYTLLMHLSGRGLWQRASRPCISYFRYPVKPVNRILFHRGRIQSWHIQSWRIQSHPLVPLQPLAVNKRLLRPLGIKYLALLTSRKLDLYLRPLIEYVKRRIQCIFEDAYVSFRVQHMPRLNASRTLARL